MLSYKIQLCALFLYLCNFFQSSIKINLEQIIKNKKPKTFKCFGEIFSPRGAFHCSCHTTHCLYNVEALILSYNYTPQKSGFQMLEKQIVIAHGGRFQLILEICHCQLRMQTCNDSSVSRTTACSNRAVRCTQCNKTSNINVK